MDCQNLRNRVRNVGSFFCATHFYSLTNKVFRPLPYLFINSIPISCATPTLCFYVELRLTLYCLLDLFSRSCIYTSNDCDTSVAIVIVSLSHVDPREIHLLFRLQRYATQESSLPPPSCCKLLSLGLLKHVHFLHLFPSFCIISLGDHGQSEEKRRKKSEL